MTLDPVSFALGVVAAYVFSCVALVVLICMAERALSDVEKERDEAVDQLLARVAVRCAERPTDSRVN